MYFLCSWRLGLVTGHEARRVHGVALPCDRAPAPVFSWTYLKTCKSQRSAPVGPLCAAALCSALQRAKRPLHQKGLVGEFKDYFFFNFRLGSGIISLTVLCSIKSINIFRNEPSSFLWNSKKQRRCHENLRQALKHLACLPFCTDEIWCQAIGTAAHASLSF